MGLKAISRLIAGSADYEEGSWTPRVEGSTVAGTQTYSSQSGHFVRIGPLVFAWGACTMTALDGATSGNVLIAGLPYAVSASSSGQASVVNNVSNVNLGTGYSQFVIRMRGGGNDDAIVGMVGDNIAATNVSNTDLTNTSSFTVLLIYQSAA